MAEPPEAGELLRLRDPRLLLLPPAEAAASVLELLCELAPLDEASLWTARLGRLRCLARTNGRRTTPQTRAQARRVLFGAGGGGSDADSSLTAIPVGRGQAVEGALVVGCDPRRLAQALVLAEEAAAALAVVLEKDALLDRAAERERALVEASERRLVRIGFDLHDGAVQDLAALAVELRLFRVQLAERLPNGSDRPRLLGRLDDLEARLLAADTELRDLARSFESPQLARRALASVLADEVESFRRRTEIDADLRLLGDPGALSDSQRIAVARIVQEALANVREHAGASRVRVGVTARSGSVRVEVTDDGRGFDVERTLVGAARGGRLGLLGMSERARLLGGTLELESRKGGPTVVAVTLPEWRPLGDARVALAND